MIEWVDVREKLPEEYGYYLTVWRRIRNGVPGDPAIQVSWYDPEAMKDAYIRAKYSRGWTRRIIPDGSVGNAGMIVTHWAHLPEPPEYVLDKIP